MKNFMYLPILAVLFLCGCKSNSFTTQRYTHFDHSSPKPVLHKPVVHTEEQMPYMASAATEQISFYASDVFDKYARPVEKAAAEKMNAANHEMKAFALAQSPHFQSIRAGNPVKTIKSGVQHVIKAGIKQQAKAAKHGLVFGLINLALFIVLCVIFVAGVIFLIMLLAV